MSLNPWLAAVFSACMFSLVAHAAFDPQAPNVAGFIEEFTREQGFAPEALEQVFSQAEHKQAILDAIARPAEKVKSWKDYRPIFLTHARINKGVVFWQANAAALASAEQEYGVPAEVIVAIIGVETFYGGNTGSWRVIDALSTLCFDYPPRAAFFCQQLKAFLVLSRQQQINPLSIKGSYAGAMGLPQFMPSSFLAYAVDFDNDQHIDIWNSPTDAIGSVANYFKQHGWIQGESVVSAATLENDQALQAVTPGIEPQYTLEQLRALGWRSTDSRLPPETKATALRLEGAQGVEYWLGLPNFYAITRYNRSPLYAMAVYELSLALRHAKEGA